MATIHAVNPAPSTLSPAFDREHWLVLDASGASVIDDKGRPKQRYYNIVPANMEPSVKALFDKQLATRVQQEAEYKQWADAFRMSKARDKESKYNPETGSFKIVTNFGLQCTVLEGAEGTIDTASRKGKGGSKKQTY